MLGLLSGLRSILMEERVDEMIVCLPVDARFSDITMIVQHARDLGIVVRLMPDMRMEPSSKHLHVEEFDDECVVTFFREQMLVQLLFKRVIDAALSVAVLVVLCPADGDRGHSHQADQSWSGVVCPKPGGNEPTPVQTLQVPFDGG